MMVSSTENSQLDQIKTNKPQLEFWFDFASTYSYLTAMRIDELAIRAGQTVKWRPFLLGPIFKKQGWDTSPFNIYAVKGNYMLRDIQRIAEQRCIEFQMPEIFPAHSLLATRLALLGEEYDWSQKFSKAIFEAEFAYGKDISNLDVLESILVKNGVEPANAFDAVRQIKLKEKLRKRTVEAKDRGVFGAPSFFTEDGELFWGDDRLEDAFKWNSSKKIT